MSRISYITHRFLLKPILQLYLKRDTITRVDGFRIKVFRHVFHPGLFFSTSYFYSFLQKLDLKEKRVLEIGCGTGILSMLAYKKGAVVTAVDVDERAVQNTKTNFESNFGPSSRVTIGRSDVFENVAPAPFDVIIINPPYYFKNAARAGEQAWYCGENGEYFLKLFSAMHLYMHEATDVYMILEENCDIPRMRRMAGEHRIVFKLEDQRKIRWEHNYIFRLEHS